MAPCIFFLLSMFSRSIHLALFTSNSLFLTTSKHTIICIITFIHYLGDGQLRCFQMPTFTSSAEINPLVCSYLGLCKVVSGHITRTGGSESPIICVFICLIFKELALGFVHLSLFLYLYIYFLSFSILLTLLLSSLFPSFFTHHFYSLVSFLSS